MPSLSTLRTWVGVTLGLALLPSPTTAQVTEPQERHEAEQGEGHDEEHSIAGRHRLSLGLGHTHVSQGDVPEGPNFRILASWALNYDYWLTDRWAVGLQNDMIVEEFVVEHGGDEVLDRDRPIAVIPSVLYKPLEWLTLVGGLGVEFAPEENLTLTRLGAEVGWHVAPDWEVGGGLLWDAKWDFYDSFSLDFTISRFLGSGR